jgi:hypothetical protein
VDGDTEMTDQQRIAELEALEKVVTPGPWKYSETNGIDALWMDIVADTPAMTDGEVFSGETLHIGQLGTDVHKNGRKQLEFIASLRNAAPELFAELRSRRAELAERDRHSADIQTRLAMLTQEVRLFLSGAAPADRGKLFTHQDVQQLSDALRANAPAVAAFLARIERQGAAKELRRMAGASRHTIDLYGGLAGSRKQTYTCVLVGDLLDRAAELEADEG